MRIHKTLKSFFASFALTVACLLSALVLGAGPSARAAAEVMPGELVVKLKSQIGATRGFMISNLQNLLGQDALTDIQLLSTDESAQVLRFSSEAKADEALATLRQSDAVEFAEPNYIYRASAAPNDPDFGKLWGMQNSGQKDGAGKPGLKGIDIGVMPLWDRGFVGSKKIMVAVIDTGIDWDHPNLSENLYRATTKLPGFEKEESGWNFFANNPNSRDDNGHGTHCAGTIGAVGNKGIGIAGVNWSVTLLPVKFLSKDGAGTLAGAVNAVNFARLKKAHLISASWGGGGKSETLEKAIADARDAGVLFVAAAGNSKSNNDERPSFPASYDLDNIVSVAAINNRGQLAKFSNFGVKSVHVAAPGESIYSSVPDGKYEYFSGTSMATPHVAGAAALLMSLGRGWDYREVRKRLIDGSTPLAALKTKVVAGGRLNVTNAAAGVKSRNR